MYMSTTVTLNEFLNRDGDHINQVVYKVDGNFNGNITGDNVTVILMGDGNINGNINARDGEIVLIKGDVNGNVKANKVICPTDQSVSDKYRNRQSYKPIKHNEDSLASPYERMDFIYDSNKIVNRYKSFVLANVTCPHCCRSFAKGFKVVTTVVDGKASNTEIQNYD